MIETSSFFVIETLGCKANVFDSQVLKEDLLKRGWIEAGPDCDRALVRLCIVNSCVVTDEAGRQSTKTAERLRREYPNAEIVMSGCMAKLAQGRGEREWPKPEPWAPAFGRTRAFVKIQEGCDSFCAYCIVPFARGPGRNADPPGVLDAVNRHVADGIREIVITGTHIGAFGDLEGLVKKILNETAIERIRLSSLHPLDLGPGLVRLIEDERRLLPHIHLSLQNAHSRILKLMGRRYDWERAHECLEQLGKISPPEGPVFVGMDVIAGFPGETDAEFEQSLENLRNSTWHRLHVFPYSERKGTRALDLPGSVEKHIRKSRAARLRELSLGRLREFSEKVITDRARLNSVLLETTVERHGGVWFSGYSANYCRVLVRDSGDLVRNKVVDVIPSAVELNSRSGEAIYLADNAHC